MENSLGIVPRIRTNDHRGRLPVMPFPVEIDFSTNMAVPAIVAGNGGARGILMTGHWMIFTARDVNRTLATSRFLQGALEETGSALLFRPKTIAKVDAVRSSHSPSGKLHMHLAWLIAPLSLMIGRIPSPVFGAHGSVLLSA